MLVFVWYKKFQEGFINIKEGSRPCQPKTIVTNVKIAAVAGLTKGDARDTLKNIAHSVIGVSS